MHVHTLRVIPLTTKVVCDGCDIALRLATADEARFVQMTDGYAEGGPMLGPTGIVVVPVNYSLYQEA